MTVRVMLVSAALSEALREARFDADGPLDAAGRRQALAAAGRLPTDRQAFTSPSVRCRETAAELGLRAEPAAALEGRAMGHWRGRTLAEVAAAEPEAVARWLAEPGFAPEGGETLPDLLGRVADWLDGLPPDAGRVVAVVEPEVVRAAVLHALGTGAAGAAAFWRLDVPPLALTELTGRAGRWNVRAATPLE